MYCGVEFVSTHVQFAEQVRTVGQGEPTDQNVLFFCTFLFFLVTGKSFVFAGGFFYQEQRNNKPSKLSLRVYGWVCLLFVITIFYTKGKL